MTYLHSYFGEIDFPRELLPCKCIRVVSLLEDALQCRQLVLTELRPVAPSTCSCTARTAYAAMHMVHAAVPLRCCTADEYAEVVIVADGRQSITVVASIAAAMAATTAAVAVVVRVEDSGGDCG